MKIRDEHKLIIRLAGVRAIGRLYGRSTWEMRKLLEGDNPAIPKHQIAGGGSGFYSRELVIWTLEDHPSYCRRCGDYHEGPCFPDRPLDEPPTGRCGQCQ